MTCHIGPYLDEIFVIVVADGYVTRTHSWRTHYDIDALPYGILCHFVEHIVEVFLEHFKVEGRDVMLSFRLYSRFVAPMWVHVDTNPVDFPSISQHRGNLTLVPCDTVAGIILRGIVPFHVTIPIPTPLIVVEIWAVGLTKAMEIDDTVVAIHVFCHEVTSFDKQFRHSHSYPGSRLL